MNQLPFAKDKVEGKVEPEELTLEVWNPYQVESFQIVDELCGNGKLQLAKKIFASFLQVSDYEKALVKVVIIGLPNLTRLLVPQLISEGIDVSNPSPNIEVFNRAHRHMNHAPIIILSILSLGRKQILTMLKYFIHDIGTDINAKNEGFYSILHLLFTLKRNLSSRRRYEDVEEDGRIVEFTPEPQSESDTKIEDELFSFILAEEKFDVNTLDRRGASPLLTAIRFSKDEWIQALLCRNDTNINLFDNNGDNAIIIACREGRLSVVKMLLSLDETLIDSRDTQKGATLLHHVIQPRTYGMVDSSNYEALLKFLLTKIDVNVTANDGQTPLHYMCDRYYSRENSGMLRILLEQPNIDVNARAQHTKIKYIHNAVHDADGNLHIHVEGEIPETLEMMTPLHVLCRQSFMDGGEVVKLMLERDDFEVDALNGEGQTGLDLANERACLTRGIIDAIEEYKVLRDFYRLANVFM